MFTKLSWKLFMLIQFALFNSLPHQLQALLIASFASFERNKAWGRKRSAYTNLTKKIQSNQYLNNHNLKRPLVNGLLVVICCVNSGIIFIIIIWKTQRMYVKQKEELEEYRVSHKISDISIRERVSEWAAYTHDSFSLEY